MEPDMPTTPYHLPEPKHLYVYDGERLSVSERFLILEGLDGERRTVETYLHGNCQLMALALSKVTGLTLGVLLQEDAFWNDDGVPMMALGHAYCLLEREGEPTLALDARGFREHDEMLAEYGDQFDFFEVRGQQASDILRDWIGGGLLRGFEPFEEDALIAYAVRMQELGLMHEAPLKAEEIKRVASFEQPGQSWQSPAF